MFVFKGLESHPRSFVKAVSWRTVGSIDTFVLGLLFSGSARLAGAIAGTEVLTKIALFYFHERAWSLVRWGHRKDPAPVAETTTLPAN
ncbi:hypothetical protein DMC47_15645 [Nostoc sp. 3335mG]|nr:hypothetical protein DMC47_15645 [Nostoc sp. 3335mG]